MEQIAIIARASQANFAKQTINGFRFFNHRGSIGRPFVEIGGRVRTLFLLAVVKSHGLLTAKRLMLR